MDHYHENADLFNPTGFPVEAKAGGRHYHFEPFSELKVYYPDDREHIKTKFKDQGIVHLNYNEAAAAKYGSFNNYKNARELEGLKELLKFKEWVLHNEMQAEREMAQSKKSTSLDKRYLKTLKFQEEIKMIKQWIKEAGGVLDTKKIEKTVESKRPEWRGKDVTHDSSKPVQNAN